MQRLFGDFARNLSGGSDPVIAIDGKALRRSFDKALGKSLLHLVRAFAAEATRPTRPKLWQETSGTSVNTA